MAKFAFIADLHLSKYSNDKIILETGLPERLHYLKNVLYEVTDYCQDNAIDTITIAGDLFHTKSIIHSIAQSILLNWFRDHIELNFNVIDGNHDLSGKGSDVVSALESINNEPNVTRYTKATLTDDILYVPYTEDMFEIIKRSKAKVLISHFGLNEGVLNSGISIVADLGINDLKGKYQTVLLGHYHKPQEIIRDDFQLWYVGSLIQLDWGEKHEDKRFLIVDTDANTVTPVLTSNYKKYYVLDLNVENRDEVLKRAETLMHEGHAVNIKKVEDVDMTDVSSSFKIIDKIDVDITNRGVDTSMSHIERNRKYLEIKNIKKADWELYEGVANRIISESTS